MNEMLSLKLKMLLRFFSDHVGEHDHQTSRVYVLLGSVAIKAKEDHNKYKDILK